MLVIQEYYHNKIQIQRSLLENFSVGLTVSYYDYMLHSKMGSHGSYEGTYVFYRKQFK